MLKIQKKLIFPPIFSNPKTETQRRDIKEAKRIFVLRYIATRLYLMHEHKSTLRKNWENNDFPEKFLAGVTILL